MLTEIAFLVSCEKRLALEPSNTQPSSGQFVLTMLQQFPRFQARAWEPILGHPPAASWPGAFCGPRQGKTFRFLSRLPACLRVLCRVLLSL